MSACRDDAPVPLRAPGRRVATCAVVQLASTGAPAGLAATGSYLRAGLRRLRATSRNPMPVNSRATPMTIENRATFSAK
jgi:hypothetical protein